MPEQLTIAVIGLGQMGHSILLTCDRLNPRGSIKVLGYDANETTRNFVSANIVNRDYIQVTHRPAKAVQQAGIIIFAVPGDRTREAALSVASDLRPNVIVTSIASVMGQVNRDLQRVLGSKNIRAPVVMAHPTNGAKGAGPETSSARMYNNVFVVIDKSAPANAREQIDGMWKRLGAHTLHLPAATHDAWFAVTSHLPHIIAKSIAIEFGNAGEEFARAISGNFWSARQTRIADAGPMLGSIYDHNATNIGNAATSFCDAMSRVRDALADRDAGRIRHTARTAFTTARSIIEIRGNPPSDDPMHDLLPGVVSIAIAQVAGAHAPRLGLNAHTTMQLANPSFRDMLGPIAAAISWRAFVNAMMEKREDLLPLLERVADRIKANSSAVARRNEDHLAKMTSEARMRRLNAEKFAATM